MNFNKKYFTTLFVASIALNFYQLYTTIKQDERIQELRILMDDAKSALIRVANPARYQKEADYRGVFKNKLDKHFQSSIKIEDILNEYVKSDRALQIKYDQKLKEVNVKYYTQALQQDIYPLDYILNYLNREEIKKQTIESIAAKCKSSNDQNCLNFKQGMQSIKLEPTTRETLTEILSKQKEVAMLLEKTQNLSNNLMILQSGAQ